MITSLRIQGFKSWRDTGSIRMAPLTAFFGTNSSGKTAILQMLLATKQTTESADRSRVLHTGDEQTYVDLGTFFDVVHGHQIPGEISFELSWRLPKPLKVSDPERKPGDILFAPDTLTCKTTLRGQTDSVFVADFAYAFEYDQRQYSFGMKKTNGEASKPAYELEATGHEPKRTRGRPWPLPAPEKSYSFLDQVYAYFQNMGFVSQVCSRRGSVAGTHSTLSSPPASSVIRNIPIARHLMRHPGKVGSWRMTSASRGSLSSPRVSSM